MTPQELKNSILQLAIQGKLVEQRPEEGTAEDLYYQLKAEKASGIKKGLWGKSKSLTEIEDGEMVGDNRVQEGMQAEYETFLLSSDIFLGKNFEREWGGAGYKIYLLDYGLVGLFFVAVFYIISLYSPNKRAYLSALILGALNFAVRDFPLWYAYYLPLLCNSNLCFPEPENDCNNENGLES